MSLLLQTTLSTVGRRAARGHAWAVLLAANACAALSMAPGPALAAPPGTGSCLPACAIAGQASFSQQGNTLVVTTTNVSGGTHSALDWPSLSVARTAGLRFDQPTAASTSINRVTGNDPSAIYGTLTSNGRVVLVNPNGITVGAGAVVDTAGFTASTLRMSDRDARTGLLSFGAAGASGPSISVEQSASVRASGGDVVLLAPDISVAADAVLHAEGGSVILAAGQKVQITGRGIEGIALQVQAPSNAAVNLGTLRGDAVAIFAATLRHSGIVQANTASVDAGRVVLSAAKGDATIGGQVTGGAIQISQQGSSGSLSVAQAAVQGDSIEIASHAAAPAGVSVTDSTLTTAGGPLSVTHAKGGVLVSGSSFVSNGGVIEVAGGQTAAATNGPGLRIADSTLDAGAGTMSLSGRGAGDESAGAVLAGAVTLSGGAIAIAGEQVSTSANAAGLVLGPGQLTLGGPATISGRTAGGGDALVIDNLTVRTSASLRLTAADGGLDLGSGSSVLNTGAGGLILESVSATAGAASSLRTAEGSTITSGGDVTVAADAIELDGSIDAGNARAVLRPSDASRAITLNAGDGPGRSRSIALGEYERAPPLNLRQSDLDHISAGTLAVGDALLTGGISIETATTVAGASTLSLRTGGDITQQPGATLSARNLNAEARSVLLDEVQIGSGAGGILSGRAHGGDFRIGNRQGMPAALQLGALDGTFGVTASGAVSIATPALLQLSQPVLSQAAGTAVSLAAGDLSRDGEGGLSTAAGRWLIYLPQPGANLGDAPRSGNAALWGRDLARDPPASVVEPGNRYLFAQQPIVDVTANATSKTYDGRAGFGALSFTAAGLIDAAQYGGVFLQDVFSGSLAVPTAAKDVGRYPIGIGTLQPPPGYALGTWRSALATITPAPLALGGLTARDKVYDGTTAATISVAGPLAGVLAGDDVRLVGSVTGAFGDKTVGAAKPVTVNATLGGADAANYTLSAVGTVLTADITPAPATVDGLTAMNKVYDGGTAATLAGSLRLTGIVAGDSVAAVVGAAAFSDKHVGTGKTVNVSGITLTGPDAGNYALAAIAPSTADITPAPLVLAGLAAQDKVYDATTSATLTGVAALAGVFSGDSVAVSVGSASFADRNVGAGKPVTIGRVTLSGPDAANYSVAVPAALAASITPAPLTIGLAATNKVYDGTAAADVSASRLQGILGADAVWLNTGRALFGDKNVGTAKPVSLTGFALAGPDAGNYAVTLPQLSADITPRTLNVGAEAQSKTYDGTTAATVTFTDDRVAGDVLTIGGSAAFADKNAGTAKPVSISQPSLSGADAPNYRLAGASAIGTADITARILNVTATAHSKVYDGTTAATVAFTDDRVAGDVLAIGGSASFADKNAGTAKPVSVTQLSLSGADAPNYRLAGASAIGTADITARILNVTATAHSKVYDGTTAATVTFTDDRVAGDVLAIGGSASFADRNAGSGKAVSLTGISLAGIDARNYRLATANASGSADITPRTLNVDATAHSKVYDGTAAATVTFTDDRVAGDVLAIGGSASFADKNAGTAKPVSVTQLSLSGIDAPNYRLAGASAISTADIAARILNVTATARDKTYDGSTAATVSVSDDAIAGDLVTIAGLASFADKNAGTAKPVSVTQLFLGGRDAPNYRLATTSLQAAASIVPAPLTLTAEDRTKISGLELTLTGAAGEFSAAGLVGGEQVPSVTLASAGTTAAAAIGDYAITPSNAAAGLGFLPANYAIAYVPGVLRVTGGTTAARAATLLQGNTSLAERVVTELSSNPLATFVALLEASKSAAEPPLSAGTTGNGKSDDEKERQTQDVPVDTVQCR